MKKILSIMNVVVILLFIVFNNAASAKEGTSVQKDIASKIIRFHVIANSNNVQDQSLKLKIKDEIIKYMNPKLSKSKDICESREILKREDKNIIKIANKVIEEKGYSYSLKTTLDKENFPIKTYGNITLPQGKYEAYRVVIGNGKGQNWWCVMFPPLCFVDVTKGEVSSKKTENQMKKIISKNEYNKIDNKKNKSIKIKSKLVETIKAVSK
ncbi:stage II sporulation protein R [Clostridium oceanicum]|uniref:Stage II sporulation protein R n=1 Tax=Clostridium oceanicum TaxID=1543 RepID=A0ABN1JPN8_9CLOT